MTGLVERLMTTWTNLPSDQDEARAAFAALYVSPVPVNGTPFRTADLLARARALNAAFSGLRPELLDVVEAPGKLVVAFRMHGTHTGPLHGPLGIVEPTGRPIAVRTIDILTLTADGLVGEVVVQADDLGMLAALGAVPIES